MSRPPDHFDELEFPDRSPGAPRGKKTPEPPTPDRLEFSDIAYLAAYPDIAQAIAAGEFASSLDHYERYGRREHRLAQPAYLAALCRATPARRPNDSLNLSVESVLISDSGIAFIVGWIDDRAAPMTSLTLFAGGREGCNTRAIARCRRQDVEAVIGIPPGHLSGFWAVLTLEAPPLVAAALYRLRLANGDFAQGDISVRRITEAELRDTGLGYFAHAAYFGSPVIEQFALLDRGVGQALVALNRRITGPFKAGAHAQYFGPAQHFSLSLIVCLFGKPEYFFLQNALFAAAGAPDGVEFIYVSNSPELTETLQKQAQIAERIYGLSIILVTLPGNAGFSAANNVAASFARSDRLVIINPDVFPQHQDWAARHAALLASARPETTRIFGVPLYYDDGSLMHGGMYFEAETGLSVSPTGVTTETLLRVEHYGKGAPVWSDRYTGARPVPAVTGAFISVDRAWFEALGGFTEDYIFGHYEDADLCLKSLQRGTPVWLHDIRFWHLEGKGSTRRPPHEGGSAVNRWLFTRRWADVLASEGLLGRTPTNRRLAGPPPDLLAAARRPRKNA
jgi:GT2 family glycosyltransferase